MKTRSIISIVVLAVYSIVIAHNIIPHHHHSEFEQVTHLCEHDEHNDHQEEINGTCCVDHCHDNHTHNHCSFDEKTILTKSISLSDLFIPSTEIEFVGLENNKQSVSDFYTPIQIPDTQCRDVLLRGPPQFS